MKYCEDCKYLQRHGSGIIGYHYVCKQTGLVIICRAISCEEFKKRTVKSYKP